MIRLLLLIISIIDVIKKVMKKIRSIINLSIIIFILLSISSCENHSVLNFWNKKNLDDCILASDLSYNQIISKEDLKKVLLINPGVILEESNGSPTKQNHGYCYYTWQSERDDIKSELSEHILIPDNNYLRIENYKRYEIGLDEADTKKQFYEEFSTLKRQNNSSSKELTSLSNYVEKENSESKKTDFPFIWKVNPNGGGKLIFLIKNEKLEISIKVSDKSDDNFKKAKEFVQIIINKCK